MMSWIQRVKQALRTKENKIHLIDRTTLYDASHKLRLLAENIDKGHWDKVEDVLVVVRHSHGDRYDMRTHMTHYGKGNAATALMLEVVKRDMMR